MTYRSNQKKVCVIGSGIWGTAIATQMNRKFGDCLILTKSSQTLEQINNLHVNKGVHLEQSIVATTSSQLLKDYENIVIAAPSYALYDVISIFKQLPPEINLIIATKGLDVARNQLISQTLEQELDNSLAILSGASFADEVIANEFTAINLAHNKIQKAQELSSLLSSQNFRVLPSNDIVGLQLSGAMKNVIAIMVGILRALNYGDNLCSIIIAKGIQELQTLARLLNPNSTYCLAFISDSVLSSTSIKSRNMSFGMQLGTGLASHTGLVEGRLVISTLLAFSAKYGFYSPLLELAEACICDPHNLKIKIDQAIDKFF
jgi:glycerol-3-phosphate dehydrogenase (NAD(P)+)